MTTEEERDLAVEIAKDLLEDPCDPHRSTEMALRAIEYGNWGAARLLFEAMTNDEDTINKIIFSLRLPEEMVATA